MLAAPLGERIAADSDLAGKSGNRSALPTVCNHLGAIALLVFARPAGWHKVRFLTSNIAPGYSKVGHYAIDLVHTWLMAGFEDLTEDERAAIVKALRQTIDNDRYPLSPRLKPFKGALAKLDPASAPKPRGERRPLPEAPSRSRGGRRTRR